MLVTGEAIDGMGKVHAHVERPFRGGHQLELLRSLGQVLPLAAIAGEVGLQVPHPVVIFVAAQHRPGMLDGTEVVVAEDTGTRWRAPAGP